MNGFYTLFIFLSLSLYKIIYMERSEFINWLETKSGLNRKNKNCDIDWRKLIDYAEYIWDEVTVEDNKVIFNWEEWELGNINYRSRECTFDEFIKLYECDELKY